MPRPALRRLIFAAAAARWPWPSLPAAASDADKPGGLSGEPIAKVAPPANKAWSEVVAKTPEGGTRMGNPDAPIKLVEYGSMTCSHCAQFSEQASAGLRDEFVSSGRVSYEFRNFVRDPIDLTVAMLARCGSPESFFPLTEQAFAYQPAMMEKAQKAGEATYTAALNAARSQALSGARRTYRAHRILRRARHRQGPGRHVPGQRRRSPEPGQAHPGAGASSTRSRERRPSWSTASRSARWNGRNCAPSCRPWARARCRDSAIAPRISADSAMQIKRLKLSGFKSFVEPAELRIEPGLTGVVGPNGCGKSNLLEAIRWVMGESSAKSMRGGGMEDVIFAGTDQRPARDFAEVVLYAEVSGLGGGDNDEEIEVVRRIERGAGSAYRVNGRDVRAKDVGLLFADAATGAHSPALVSQGKIAAVIAAKPAERRLMLEEAAGISGLHVRRKDAEQKLRATEANLARLDDLMAALDAQIGSLRRQARAAERYKAVSDKIRLAEARLVFARWRDAAAAAEAARGEAQAADARVDQAQGASRAAQDAQRTAAEALAAARDTLADRRDDASAHGHRMAAVSSQLEAAEQRLADLQRQRERLEAGPRRRRPADPRRRRSARTARARAGRGRGPAGRAKRRAGPPCCRRSSGRKAPRARPNWRWRRRPPSRPGSRPNGASPMPNWRRRRAGWSGSTAEAQRHAATLAGLAREGDLRGRRQRRPATLASRPRRRCWPQRDRRSKQQQARKGELQQARDDAASRARRRAGRTGRDRARARRPAARPRGAGETGAGQAWPARRARPGPRRAGLRTRAGRGAGARCQGGAGRRAARRGRTLLDRGRSPGAGRRTASPRMSAHCPPQLAARLALVHVADADDARALAGRMAGDAARAAAPLGRVRRARRRRARKRPGSRPRTASPSSTRELPGKRAAAAEAEAVQARVQAELGELQRAAIAAERALAAAAEDERTALRALDQARRRAHARSPRRRDELAAAGERSCRAAQAGRSGTRGCRGAPRGPARSPLPAAPRSPRRRRGTMPPSRRSRPPPPRSPRTTSRWP